MHGRTQNFRKELNEKCPMTQNIGENMSSKHKQLWENLKDPDFRKQFIDAHVNEGIAFQIRSLRNKKELTQPEFAQQLGVKKSLVSAWENPAYGKHSLNTLKKLAKAFDVGLLVRFVPFSSLVDWTVNLTSKVIAPPSFEEEESESVMDLHDYIRCHKVSPKEFQTKDTPAQFLEHYEIREDGFFWHQKCDKRWVKENFTGEISFGDSKTLFIATFFKGKLKSFIESKGKGKLRYYVDKEGA